jgi:uncharacterized membrane protein YidH (DUF202 family)
MNFLIGIVLAIIGTLVLVFAQQIYNFTGAIDFVESRMPGYSKGFIKLMGIVMVVVGVLFFTGVGGFITQPILEGIQGVFRLGGK